MSQIDFGIVGNGQVSALIDRSGSMVWSCLPDPDSPSVFASLLDPEKGGSWSVEPMTRQKGSESKVVQVYLGNTAVLSTRFFLDSETEFELIDFAPSFSGAHSRNSWSRLIRVLRPIRGSPFLRVKCLPRLDYASCTSGGKLHSQCIEWEGSEHRLFLTSSLPLSRVFQSKPFQLDTVQFFVLSSAPFSETPSVAEVLRDLDVTLQYWETWAQQCHLPASFQKEVLRSAVTLKLHCFESTGAILAATTTSLPEGPERGRTWDYRYCWLRDAYFVVSAFYRLGRLEEVEKFIRFFLKIIESDPSGILQPVYGLRGEKVITERELKHLAGFKGLGPVRVGNAAYSMKQFDVYGEMILVLSLAFFDERLKGFERKELFSVIQLLISKCRECFGEPDAGIWEFRGKKSHFLFSKLMMWVGLRKGSEIARAQGLDQLSKEWGRVAQEMKHQMFAYGWRERLGIFAQSYSDSHPDASLLLMPHFGFFNDHDLKLKRMVSAYDQALSSGLGVYRYRAADDFGIPKTLFLICSFWMVDALWRVGQKKKAHTLFQQTLQHANHLGLLSEDMDSLTGELWGNFPQCYSHAGLIHAAFQISQ